MYFFSPSTGGFYAEEVHGKSMPSDVAAVSDARHAELMDGQTQGLRIAAGAGGAPELVQAASAPMPEVVNAPPQIGKAQVDKLIEFLKANPDIVAAAQL